MSDNAPHPYRDWNWHRWQAGRTMEWHTHEFLQSIHVIEGSMDVDWGAGWQSCAAGHVHILPPNHSHRLRSPGGHRQFGLNWHSQTDERGLLQALLDTEPKPGIWHAPDLVDRVASLHGIHAESGAIAKARQGHILDHYTLGLHDLLDAQRHDLWSRVVELLQANIDRPLRIEWLTERLGCSRAHIQRLCHQRHQCGLASFHSQRRIAAAGRFLATQDTSIAECAQTFGFHDQAQFSRAFKRETGMTPSDYRRQHRPVL